MSVIVIAISTIILVLWLNGRYRRNHWTTVPEVRMLQGNRNASSSTAVILFTGAFNGPPHTEGIEHDVWRDVGDTYIVDYPLRRFSTRQTALASYMALAEKGQYDRIIVQGFSLGGIVAMQLLQLARKYDSTFAQKLEMIVADSPLLMRHLRIPGGKAFPPRLMRLMQKTSPYLHFVHVGPLSNLLLSKLVAKIAFQPAAEELREPAMDQAQFGRHMAFLRDNKLSVVVEQSLAIASHERLSPQSLGYVPIVYLQCGDGSIPDSSKSAPDNVIMGDAAFEEWRWLFPGIKHLFVGPKTIHTAVVEGWESWNIATKEAVALLDTMKKV